VVLDRRPADALQFTMMSHCPVCGSLAVREFGKADHRCTGGLFCSAQRKQSLWHFSQRRALDIDGLGEELIDSLVDSELIKSPADLYDLTLDKLIGQKLNGGTTIQYLTAKNLISSIDKSKKTDLWRLIFGLGIRHVGETTAKRLATEFQSIENIAAAPRCLLDQFDDIGFETAGSIVDFFNQKVNNEVVCRLNKIFEFSDNFSLIKRSKLDFFKVLKSIKLEMDKQYVEKSPFYRIGDVKIQSICSLFGNPDILIKKYNEGIQLDDFSVTIAGIFSVGFYGDVLKKINDLGFEWIDASAKEIKVPVSIKLRRILKSKTDLDDQEIDDLGEGNGWSLVYSLSGASASQKDKRFQICFTGFGVSDKNEMVALAEDSHLKVVTSVTKGLQYLVAGPNAGPSKIATAQKQGTKILSKEQFYQFIETGELI
jgi:DNA ligase (NAD+)